jgi:hypothetical protein
MFASKDDSHLSASVLASNQLKVWEGALALRVSLQKPMDGVGMLPVDVPLFDSNHSDLAECATLLGRHLRKQTYELASVLDASAGLKRKAAELSEDCDVDTLWESTLRTQEALQKQKWEPVLNKWHARLNFGSEGTKAKLKVFTQTMWDQVHIASTPELSSVAYVRCFPDRGHLA